MRKTTVILISIFLLAAAALGQIMAATWTDHSSTITAGGTSQTAIALNGKRKGFLIMNPCSATSQGIGSAENLFINFTSAASTSSGNSIELQPCGSYDREGGMISTEAITVNAATTGHQYLAKELQ